METFKKNADYMIHVFIEKTKDIKSPDNQTVDPIFLIESLGIKKYSGVKNKVGGIGEIKWSEHIFLEPRNVDKRDADDSKIMIKLMDKGFMKDVLIGEFEIDMSYIYLQEQHLFLHKWLALNNPHGDDPKEISAYVKLSISVAASGDQQHEIKEDDKQEEDSQVMMSPSLNPKFYQIKLRFFQAQDLLPMDMQTLISKAKIDAFIKIQNINGRDFESDIKVMEEGGKPVNFNTEFWIISQLPIKEQRIRVKLMDQDDVTKNEHSGSFILDTKDIINDTYNNNNKFIWKNFWGSPLNQIPSDYKTLMNDNPELASTWKGRILMQIVCEPCDKPESKKQAIDQEIIEQAKQQIFYQGVQRSLSVYEDKQYMVYLRIGQAISLPSFQNYKMKVTIGGKQIIFKAFDSINKSSYKRYEDNKESISSDGTFIGKEFKFPYNDINEISKVVFQLMDESDNPVCYFIDDISKYKTAKVLDDDQKFEEPKLKWVQLVPDLCVNKVNEYYKSGIFSFIFQIHDVSKDGIYEFKQHKQWIQKQKKRVSAYQIRVFIYSCRNLPAADQEGTSDPFVQIWDTTNNSKKTDVIEKSTNPQYYKVIDIDYLFEATELKDMIKSIPPFILDVYDSNKGLFGQEGGQVSYLGRAMIEATNCSILFTSELTPKKISEEELNFMKIPRWHPIRYAPKEPQCGEILVRFEVGSQETGFEIKKADDIKLYKQILTKDMEVSLLILGLRNLQSTGVLPVKKAFIKFNIKSLVSYKNNTLNDVLTQPTSSGANPTLNLILNFNIPLPVDPLYSPALQCTVYDFIMKGLTQPIIGNFVIQFGEVIQTLIEKRKQEISDMQYILNEMKELLENPNILLPASYQSISQKLDLNLEQIQTQNEDQDEEEKRIKRLNLRLKTEYKKFSQSMTEKNDLQEKLGANEAEGNNIAQLSEQQQLEIVKQKQQDLITTMLTSRKLDSSRSINSKQQVTPRVQKTKEQIEQEYKELQDFNKRYEKNERQRDLEIMISKGIDGFQNILMPKYKLDKRLKIDKEINHPYPSLFIPIGWDQNSQSAKKHYRKYFTEELEIVKSIFPRKSPFDSYDIVRGQSRKSQNSGIGNVFAFNKKRKLDDDAKSLVQNVGKFKAIIQIESTEEKEKFIEQKTQMIEELKSKLNQFSEKTIGKPWHISIKKLISPIERKIFQNKCRALNLDHLKISENIAQLDDIEILKQGLNTAQKCIIRAYMLSAFDLSSRDNGSASDSYLILECNGQIYNERDNYQLDEPCPQFNKMFDFKGEFPGSTLLKIQIWDFDSIFGDDIIGTTYVDLEDRFFSIQWNSLEHKPIEYRKLYHPQSSLSQGVVKCWFEIIPAEVKEDQIITWDISSQPIEEFEVRICVLECRDFEIAVDEGLTDAYLRGYFNPNEDVQETDTHFRCSDGCPDFQYRLVYKIKIPDKNGYIFNLQAYDRDFFKSNDMLGQAQIDLKELIYDCQQIGKPLILNKNYYQDVLLGNDKNLKLDFDNEDNNKFWINIIQKSKNGGIKINGQVKLQIDILPLDLAIKNPVGKAREKNHSPFLPQPKGRVQLSLNPVKMIEQMLSPQLKRKIILYLAAILCVVMCIAILPNILGALVVRIL